VSTQGFEMVEGSFIRRDLKYVFPLLAGMWNAVVLALKREPGVRTPGVFAPDRPPGVAKGLRCVEWAGDRGPEGKGNASLDDSGSSFEGDFSTVLSAGPGPESSFFFRPQAIVSNE
jgi:hypothetical protein